MKLIIPLIGWKHYNALNTMLTVKEWKNYIYIYWRKLKKRVIKEFLSKYRRDGSYNSKRDTSWEWRRTGRNEQRTLRSSYERDYKRKTGTQIISEIFTHKRSKSRNTGEGEVHINETLRYEIQNFFEIQISFGKEEAQSAVKFISNFQSTRSNILLYIILLYEKS
jgi:hypothetical protein